MGHAHMPSVSAPGVGLMVSVSNILNEQLPSRYFYFVLLSNLRLLTGEFSISLLIQSESNYALGSV